jgi:hypothetical protein
MRRTAVEMAALAALLLGGALACGQPAAPPAAGAGGAPAAGADKPKDAPAKSKLEEMLQKALQDNPDLRLAAAKVAEAEAELNRARLQVVQKVGAAYQAVEAQKAAVESAAAELQETSTAYKAATVSQATVRAAEQKLLDAKAKLAALETEMPYLIGKQPANNAVSASGAMMGAMMGGGIGSPGAGGITPGGGALEGRFGGLGGGLGQGGGGLNQLGGGLGQLGGGLGALGAGLGGALGGDSAPKSVPVLGPTADRIRAALDKPFSLDVKEANLSEVIANVSTAFQKANPGLLIKCNFTQGQLDEKPISVKFDQMPFGAVLVWIEDSAPNSLVVVRDYGLVIAPNDQLPPGAPSLHDFWNAAGQE